MRSADAITTLEELGATQWGLVTTGQAESYGVSRVDLGRLRGNDMIHRLRRGVYSLPSASDGPLQDLRAAWLATDPRTLAEVRTGQGVHVVVSHVSAAAVHQLGDLIPTIHEFTSTKRRQSTHEDVHFYRSDLPDEDRDVVDGLPVTAVPRTVQDLASTGGDLDHLAGVVRDALSKPEVRPIDLANKLDPLAPRYGHDTGQTLIDECLDRAGLPAVAANLTGSNALLAAFTKSLGDAVWTPVIEQMREIVTQHTGPLRPVQDQLGKIATQGSPSRKTPGHLPGLSGKSLCNPQSGRYRRRDQDHDKDAGSPENEDSSPDEDDET